MIAAVAAACACRHHIVHHTAICCVQSCNMCISWAAPTTAACINALILHPGLQGQSKLVIAREFWWVLCGCPKLTMRPYQRHHHETTTFVVREV